MGNKARSQRSTPHRIGPLARAADVESAEASRLEKAEHNRLYQQCHCKKSILRLEEVEIFMKETAPDERGIHLCERRVESGEWRAESDVWRAEN